MHKFAIAATLLLFPVSLDAQWLNYRTPGIPRTADGQPNLTAPTPRTSDGKPDLSGLWRPEMNAYNLDVIQDLKDEAIFRPAAEAIFKQHLADFHSGDPITHCLPGGPVETLTAGGIALYRIIQSPNLVGLLYERGIIYRQIFMDGRELPKDPNPAWMGYSVGHWDGDTLVVESAGYNDRTWLDRVGHPHSEDLRYRRVDFGHIQFQITYDDPKTLTRPLTISLAVNYAPDTEMLEAVCENERDSNHLVGKANAGVKLSSATLAKYAGTYEFREGPAVVAGFFGRTKTLTVVDGQLWMNAIPLIPQSDTWFDSTAAPVEFFLDAAGRVTHFILGPTEGEARYDRNPNVITSLTPLTLVVCRYPKIQAMKDNPKGRMRWAALALCCGVPVALGAAVVGHERQKPRMPLQARQRDSSVAGLKFEVASVRAASQQPAAGQQPETRGGGGGRGGSPLGCRARTSVDGALANFTCQNLGLLVSSAFGVLPDQITGVDWSAFSERFDIAAKLPEGATREQVPEMVLSLLEERFNLTFHRGSREEPIYALVAAKGGPKLQPAAEAADAAGVPPASSMAASSMAMMNGVSFRQTRIPNPDGKGFTVIMNTPAMGTVREPEAAQDIRRWEAPSISAEGLAELLTIAVGGPIPVRDMTGLEGRYDVELELSMADSLATAPEEFQNALFKAGQDALKRFGLQLERRKGPIEIVVIDHLEKTPTGN
jgi:uncharacterized protein (TIGR03435 family)